MGQNPHTPQQSLYRMICIASYDKRQQEINNQLRATDKIEELH